MSKDRFAYLSFSTDYLFLNAFLAAISLCSIDDFLGGCFVLGFSLIPSSRNLAAYLNFRPTVLFILFLRYCLLTRLQELSTRSPKSTLKTKLSSFCRNHRNRFRAGLRTPNFEPGRTFFSSQRFQVMPFADGLRIAHSFGEFAQSLFA